VTWARTPLFYTPPRLPSDRVVLGQVRNGSGRMLALDARRFVVRDAAGRRLVSSTRFTNSYAHALYGAFQQPGFIEPSELARLGVIIDLQPGATAPLFVAYRLRPGSKPPFTASFGGGFRLPLPETRTRP
jgi:hypothetical protein